MGHFFSFDPESTVAEVGKCPPLSFDRNDMMGRWDTLDQIRPAIAPSDYREQR